MDTENIINSSTSASTQVPSMKQFKLLLWINKIIKYPFSSEAEFQRDIPHIISQISSEFANHQNQLQVTLQQCNQGSSHKKCKSLHIVKVQLKHKEEGEKGIECQTDNATSQNISQNIHQFQSSQNQSNPITQKLGYASNDIMSPDVKSLQYNIQPVLNLQTKPNSSSLYYMNHGATTTFNQNNLTETDKLSDILSKLRNHKGQLHCPFQDCDRNNFTEAGNLKTHIRTHLPDRVFKCQYMDCGKTFKLKQHLKHHLDSHQNLNRFVCNFTNCQKSFSRASRLELHVKSAHSGQNTFLCEIAECGKIFAEKGNLLVHMRTHTGEKPYHCRHCEKKFTTIGNCRDHERRHTKDKPYKCKMCPIKYYRRYQLLRHLESKHPYNQISEFDNEDVDEDMDRDEDHILVQNDSYCSQDLCMHDEEDLLFNNNNRRSQKEQRKQEEQRILREQQEIMNLTQERQLFTTPHISSSTEIRMRQHQDSENCVQSFTTPDKLKRHQSQQVSSVNPIKNGNLQEIQQVNFSLQNQKRQKLDIPHHASLNNQVPVKNGKEYLLESKPTQQFNNTPFERDNGEDEGFSPILQESPIQFNSSYNQQEKDESYKHKSSTSSEYMNSISNFMSRKTTSFDSYYESLQTTIKLSPEEQENSMKFNFDQDFNANSSLDFESLEFEASCFFPELFSNLQ
eukprot:403331539